MTKSKDRDSSSSSERLVPHRSLLFELKGKKATEDGNTTAVSSEMFAALSIEEVIAYVRTRQPGSEIMELKVLGKFRYCPVRSICRNVRNPPPVSSSAHPRVLTRIMTDWYF